MLCFFKIADFGRRHKKGLKIAAAAAVGTGLSYAAQKYGAKDGKIQKHGGGLARGINYAADNVYNNRASNYLKDKAGKLSHEGFQMRYDTHSHQFTCDIGVRDCNTDGSTYILIYEHFKNKLKWNIKL